MTSTINPFDCQVRSEFELFLDQLLQVFGPVLAQYTSPFQHTYAAVHVRHGDKVVDLAIFGLRKHVRVLRKVWPRIQRIFVTSDDSTVIKAASEALRHGNGENVTVRWTAGETRWSGGVPSDQNDDHDHDSAAVRAVLSDFSAMALSSVLVGYQYSNFFNSARLLRPPAAPTMVPRCANSLHCDTWIWIYTFWGPRLFGMFLGTRGAAGYIVWFGWIGICLVVLVPLLWFSLRRCGRMEAGGDSKKVMCIQRCVDDDTDDGQPQDE